MAGKEKTSMARKHDNGNYQWRVMDIHIHTPASSDFQQPEVTYLDILQRAEARGVDILGFTDHNTLLGYRTMQEEIQGLELLERLNRLMPNEETRLKEYRRLLGKLLILPGFEFTATFGFHILALFSPRKPIREIEHLLLSLNIPSDSLDEGSQTVGASSDVLQAYRLINEAGGLVIAAHANSSNGVAMRGFNFGGQTKIAYTQDFNLHALEVTDLDQKGPRTTATFFNGTKPEYPRRMHCIQGSDAHRLTTDPQRKKNLGVGDRTTEVLIPELSFEAILDLFRSNDFSRTRPRRQKEEPAYDFIQAALEEGANIIQDFHESMTVRSGKLYAILADVCAFANVNGGTLYIGLAQDPHKPPVGVPDHETAISQLEREISNRISPPLSCTVGLHEFRSKKIIRILVPRGDDPPYAVDDNKIYVRDEAETGLAVRDEIVGLVARSKSLQALISTPVLVPVEEKPSPETFAEIEELPSDIAPKTGVEVLKPEERQGKQYFTMRDLRNGNMVKNVTRASARRLWHYAITEYTELAPNLEQANIHWVGDFGLIKKHRQGKLVYFDMVHRSPAGVRYFYGVTHDGIHGPWKQVVGDEEG
ncbi:MAG TPA: putative DNA binding domain-containing protein [Anaerolineaceae bacterium]|nr:putative DNA binding domain-containing protein [Anaerolineaceae bacterium]